MSGILNAFVGGSYGASPVNTVAPAVTGTAQFGSTLTTTNGCWSGSPTPTYTYQWYRSPSTSIGGATSNTYTLVSADVGNTLYAKVTATNAIGSASANSNTTSTIAAIAPGAPTIGTATATSCSAISVSFTAPSCTGGASITGYQAVCTSSGTNSATGSSSPISVTGLSPSTSYTFHVRAQNSAGYGSYSGNASATTSSPRGSQSYTSPGSYTWVAPAGVTSVSVVAIGGGQSGAQFAHTYPSCSKAGSGGGLGYLNNRSVTPGCSYNLIVGAGGYGKRGCNQVGNYGSASWFFCSGLVKANGGGPCGGTHIGCGGGNGGVGHINTFCCSKAPCYAAAGGGGAGGYSGNGGNGSVGYNANGSSGSGGGGGGGGGANFKTSCGYYYSAGGGGGTGLFGQGSNGAGGSYNSGSNGSGGGGGSSGSAGQTGTTSYGGPGGAYGGGGGVGLTGRWCCGQGRGACGAIRIVWPGSTRKFPSTDVGSP